ncbi:hypothetical protein H5410_063172 [Solanum commersonii]|uniref:Uncharacterized protein n=1 Tax=Solanum commersonii TaxID=4109 RepID=A0A9J5WEV6_SOLCO|nr:hypothetical protein H5410_063172 [Solanum commersonii]
MFHLLFLVTLFLHVQSVPQNSSIVEYLPGFDGPLPFYLQTGYIGVGKSEEVQLFYYFVKSESDPSQDPLLLWLTGGPGCSSFSGLAYEVGPLEFGQKAYNGSLPILVSSPYSWTKFASILFLEQPVNTGFSYATTSAYKCTDLQACDHVYEFLTKWFVNHPEFISNPFYVSGDSYSGITIPVIIQLISNGIEAGKEPLINLKGYSLGNPVTFFEESNYQIPYSHGMGLISDELYELVRHVINNAQILEPNCGVDFEFHPSQSSSETLEDDFICQESRVATNKLATYWSNDPRVQEALHVRKVYSLGNPKTFPEEVNYKIPFCHGMGLISDELYESLKQTCKGEYLNIKSTHTPCSENLKIFKELVSGICDEQVLKPYCGIYSEEPKLRQSSSERRSLEDNFIFLNRDDFTYRRIIHVDTHNLSVYWANDPKVQEALHVRKGTIKRTWARCRQSIGDKSYAITFMNSIPYHTNLSTKGYRSLIYSGDHDMVVPFQSTQAWIKFLNYPIIDDWRPWLVDEQVGGYTRSYSNHMTYATVKGGGHTAPEDRPEESFHMFKRWISQQPL